ncbi:MAG TPA: SUMF1/EgtB/PvdO family nonheme iron enzyme [Nitrospira sp.]|nr:SUMF1/EgtB/PvdO family nonheme iron enzyme [Nitrospira sp.]
MGVSAAKAGRGAVASVTVQPVTANLQTALPVSDSPGTKVQPPPGPAPEGMVWIPGGEFWMGAEEFPDAQPWHRVSLDGFWMDKTEVTNDQFEKFVTATKYVTVAERTPRPEDFPGAPPDNLVAGSVVFSPPDHPVRLNDYFQWWSYVDGANWRRPEGPKSTIKDRGNYPVVHIAHEDAQAERCEIFALQMERCRFLQVLDGFIQRPSLCDNRNFKTFSHVPGLLPGSNHCRDGLLQVTHPTFPAAPTESGNTPLIV